ncbi:hypothetical protein M8J76_013117 [Diaphorina citri]|nr:hypothetical protein M8J75_004882 [Diaphorina citri]KAI5741395.1 hypothetical protein M8J76_013117 [Diaphorina citri]
MHVEIVIKRMLGEVIDEKTGEEEAKKPEGENIRGNERGEEEEEEINENHVGEEEILSGNKMKKRRKLMRMAEEKNGE